MSHPNKRVLLLCDGGQKNKEFAEFAKYLKDGDVIMCHDYTDNPKEYEIFCIEGNWLAGPESFWDEIKESVEEYNLNKFIYHDEFKKSLWGSFSKGNSIYTYRTNVINYLFKKYKFENYLEIGVYDPTNNFNNINAKLKHSVDNYEFEPFKDLYTHNMTSDEFFENAVGNQMYDVIFIDGLHEYEQVYKDFKNAMEHLNYGGFIILHDVNPIEESNIMPYQQFLEQCPYRWNGTVYKAFLRLKDELKTWSCFSVDEPSGGMGIFTKNKLVKNSTLLHDYEWYFDWNNFNTHRDDILRMITYKEYTDLIDKDTEK